MRVGFNTSFLFVSFIGRLLFVWQIYFFNLTRARADYSDSMIAFLVFVALTLEPSALRCVNVREELRVQPFPHLNLHPSLFYYLKRFIPTFSPTLSFPRFLFDHYSSLYNRHQPSLDGLFLVLLFSSLVGKFAALPVQKS